MEQIKRYITRVLWSFFPGVQTTLNLSLGMTRSDVDRQLRGYDAPSGTFYLGRTSKGIASVLQYTCHSLF